MNKNISTPAWLIALAIFAQVLLGLLSATLIYKQYNQPKQWSLDSTTYYKYLEGQGRLNLRLYEQQQSHDERLRKLDKARKGRHSHIDSLSGDALQREIDQIYNGTRQSQPTGGAPGTETNSANRSRSASGTEGQSGPDHAQRRGGLSGHATDATAYGAYQPEQDYSAAEQRPAAGKEPGHDCPIPDRRLPDEVARSQTGNLDLAGWAGVVRGRQAKTNLAYWQLIREQGYTYPDVAFAISAVETGYWSERVQIMKYNNLFAFKANSRKNYVRVDFAGYCIFPNRASSLDDYAAYEKQVIAKYGLRNRQEYIDHICRRFCPSPSYRGKLALAFQSLKALT